ncbi:MAG: ABC transporter ATP-binding protein [Verrucomicrobia bacterium]|nr:ABC transporter ATP-binding protein [Verrucomicrobiota bacterium]
MIELREVTKKYPVRGGERTVLDRITFRIERGEKIGFLGRNGAGKSTLIRLIGGAEAPTSGEIYRGMSLSWPLAFGGAFQGQLTGLDNLKFICRVYGRSIEDKIPFVEDFSELGRYFREPVGTYSSGMQARLAFAISMAVEFDCYLIDEVMTVGDRRFTQKCHEELMVKRADRSLIVVSHHEDQIRNTCTHLGVLVQGVLHRFEDLDEGYDFYHRHAHE